MSVAPPSRTVARVTMLRRPWVMASFVIVLAPIHSLSALAPSGQKPASIPHTNRPAVLWHQSGHLACGASKVFGYLAATCGAHL